MYVTIPQCSEPFRNMCDLWSGQKTAKSGLHNDPIDWFKLHLNQPKIPMGSVPNCQKEIVNRQAIRWFKFKLKPPKNATSFFQMMLKISFPIWINKGISGYLGLYYSVLLQASMLYHALTGMFRSFPYTNLHWSFAKKTFCEANAERKFWTSSGLGHTRVDCKHSKRPLYIVIYPSSCISLLFILPVLNSITVYC